MNKKYIRFTILLFSIILSGCAGTKGSVNLLDSSVSSSQLSKYTDVVINVNSTKGIQLSQFDKDRLTLKIEQEIKAENPSRFKTINSPSSGRKKLRAMVTIKEYEEGNAFARLILSGLGQIHIDADIMLSDYLSKKILAQYEITKTFAWGGFYGAATKIQQVEEGFCKAVADSIIGDD
jgi:hypothetical protein